MSTLSTKITDAFCFLTIITTLSLAGVSFYTALLFVDALVQGI